MNVRNFIYYFLVVAVCVIPLGALANAIQYQPLVGIPGIDPRAEIKFGDYINQLYFLSISIAALLAVIKIIIAGVKYMLTDLVTDKSSAKDDIRSSLLGLLLIVSAVVILTTVNPDLRNLNVFQGPAINPPPPPRNINGQTVQVTGAGTAQRTTDTTTGQETTTPRSGRAVYTNISAAALNEAQNSTCARGGGTITYHYRSDQTGRGDYTYRTSPTFEGDRSRPLLTGLYQITCDPATP